MFRKNAFCMAGRSPDARTHAFIMAKQNAAARIHKIPLYRLLIFFSPHFQNKVTLLTLCLFSVNVNGYFAANHLPSGREQACRRNFARKYRSLSRKKEMGCGPYRHCRGKKAQKTDAGFLHPFSCFVGYTSSMIAISAASPRRGPTLMMRV